MTASAVRTPAADMTFDRAILQDFSHRVNSFGSYRVRRSLLEPTVMDLYDDSINIRGLILSCVQFFKIETGRAALWLKADAEAS